MRNAIAAAVGFFAVTILVSGAYGVDLPPPQGPHPVELQVGETLFICQSGKILCPATGAICDDLKVATPVDTPDGIGFKGVGPGTTLCGAQGRLGTTGRPVWRITVRGQNEEGRK